MDALQDGGELWVGGMEATGDPLKHSGKPEQHKILCLECCVGKQVDVPWHLMMRYSTLLTQRLK